MNSFNKFDGYIPQALAIIDLQAKRFARLSRRDDNPRWLIALGDGSIASSQDHRVAGRLDIASSDFGLWRDHYCGGEHWFRSLKHTYLDVIGLQGGMPTSHPLRKGFNDVQSPTQSMLDGIEAHIKLKTTA